MRSCFITATGTEIGKTYVTTLLCRQLRDAGYSVRALKPVISGFDPADCAESDTVRILKALDIPATEAKIEAISPWRFRAPLSPDMAAEREGRGIDFAALTAFCRPGSEDVLLIEGVGGAMVPLTGTQTVADWIAALDVPALVVAGSYLGTISHTLTTVTALQGRGVAVAAAIVSESETSPVPLAETVGAIRRFVSGVPVVALPRGAATVDGLSAVFPRL
ncbi:MAG: dethiobiotin synthase [Alphaproteobacteria bacterium]